MAAFLPAPKRCRGEPLSRAGSAHRWLPCACDRRPRNVSGNDGGSEEAHALWLTSQRQMAERRRVTNTRVNGSYDFCNWPKADVGKGIGSGPLVTLAV
jgi:hypothetical protein